MKVRGVIFDMDGTITAPYLDFAKIKGQAGLGDVDLVDYLRRATGAEYERIHGILKKFEEDGVANARLNRGARTVLSYLSRRKIPTALLTRNSRKSVAGVCRKFKLKFDMAISREDGPHKPAPEPIWEIAARWKIKPSEVLIVGDYKWDLMCAHNAGAPCALLVNGRGLPDWGKDAEYVITRLTEVIRIVDSVGATPRGRPGQSRKIGQPGRIGQARGPAPTSQ